MVSTRVCQSEGSGFKSRSGQIAYLHGVKTRLSTLGTGDMFLVVRNKFGGHKKTTGEAGIVTIYQCISGIRLGLQWKLRTP